MLKNYFTIAFRTLHRNKEYSLINIAGLAISLASCLLLFAVLRSETSFDTFHKNAASLYRVTMNFEYPEGDIHTPGVPKPAPDAFRTDFPQLTHQATLFSIPNMAIAISSDGQPLKHFKEEKGGMYIEAEFFDMFDFKWLHGNAQSALTEPNSAVLDKETAEKFFGSWQDAIGKSILVDEKYLVKISGILDATPDNTDFPIHVGVSFKTRKEPNLVWGDVTSRRQHYIQLPEGMSAAQMAALLPAFRANHITEADDKGQFGLEPLSAIHYDDRYGNLNMRTISKSTLWSFGVIGAFLLLTAAINFINLAVAQVIRKSKEVGVRKVLGSYRHQLIMQFLGETLLILVVAAVVSILFAEAALPILQPILYLPKHFSVFDSDIFLFLGVVVVVLTFLAGAYPAFVMAGFQPVAALKSRISTSEIGGVSLRKGLVVVQFVIAQILLIVTIVVFLQINFFQNAPKGFNSESVVYFPLPKDSVLLSRMDAFKNVVLRQKGVASATLSYTPPSSRNNNSMSFRFDRSTKDEPFELNVKFADVDYFSTYQLHFVAGRPYQQTDTAAEYVVNEKFLKKLGISTPQEALGKTVTANQRTLPIVGVISDFHNLSFHNEIAPIAISSARKQYEMMSVKLESGNQKEALKNLASVFSSFFPSTAFDYRFLEDYMASSYQQEERLARMTILFSSISIFISCLGLYGLISFLAVQRTKEVGIRKLLGASLNNILFIFYKEFIILVLLAFIIAGPVAGYVMSDWLSHFVYHVDLMAWVFFVAVGGTLLIALFTLSFQAIKAALANPVDSLRSE